MVRHLPASTIQLALIGLVGMSVLLLADSFGCATPWPTRMGVGIFRLLAARESQAHSTARHGRERHRHRRVANCNSSTALAGCATA
jgi:hypothetical protein